MVFFRFFFFWNKLTIVVCMFVAALFVGSYIIWFIEWICGGKIILWRLESVGNLMKIVRKKSQNVFFNLINFFWSTYFFVLIVYWTYEHLLVHYLLLWHCIRSSTLFSCCPTLLHLCNFGHSSTFFSCSPMSCPLLMNIQHWKNRWEG